MNERKGRWPEERRAKKGKSVTLLLSVIFHFAQAGDHEVGEKQKQTKKILHMTLWDAECSGRAALLSSHHRVNILAVLPKQ